MHTTLAAMASVQSLLPVAHMDVVIPPLAFFIAMALGFSLNALKPRFQEAEAGEADGADRADD